MCVKEWKNKHKASTDKSQNNIIQNANVTKIYIFNKTYFNHELAL